MFPVLLVVHQFDWAIRRATPCASPLLTARPSAITWPRSFTDGWRTCWAGMSFPLWEALYRRWSNLHPAVGIAASRTRPRPPRRRRWRRHTKRTRRRTQRHLHGKTSVQPQRPLPRKTLHPKILHGKTAGAPRGAVSVGDPWTPARLLPSLTRNPGPLPRQRHRRPQASSATTARASATPPVPANASLCVCSGADPTGAPYASTSASMELPPILLWPVHGGRPLTPVQILQESSPAGVEVQAHPPHPCGRRCHGHRTPCVHHQRRRLPDPHAHHWWRQLPERHTYPCRTHQLHPAAQRESQRTPTGQARDCQPGRPYQFPWQRPVRVWSHGAIPRRQPHHGTAPHQGWSRTCPLQGNWMPRHYQTPVVREGQPGIQPLHQGPRREPGHRRHLIREGHPQEHHRPWLHPPQRNEDRLPKSVFPKI